MRTIKRLCPIGGKIKIIESTNGNALGSIVRVLMYAYFSRPAGKYIYTTDVLDTNAMSYYVCASLTKHGSRGVMPGGKPTWLEDMDNPIVDLPKIDDFKIL